ncbi:hypothetical protein GFH48_03260 [Streptomyces fagopyri]|uniref:Uncharacterized protein n=1 Tax=Streptomyces fagopyri TaxID=2662397 RepID=A0A5Q0L6B1_9ACTN|nr:hypothetical protein [Streptomyces fagopyri]QFZ72408.1 hypothetical protein GFH48_03260 [Streptomyces fagopyri]
MGAATAANPVMTADRIRGRVQVVLSPRVPAALHVLDALELGDLNEVVAAIDEKERTSAPGDEARARFIHR